RKFPGALFLKICLTILLFLRRIRALLVDFFCRPFGPFGPPDTMPSAPANNDRRYVMLAFRIIGEFGATIALPVVVLALLGKYLDARYGTTPWLRVAGFVLAAFITATIIKKRATYFGKEYEALNKADEKPKHA